MNLAYKARSLGNATFSFSFLLLYFKWVPQAIIIWESRTWERVLAFEELGDELGCQRP